MEDPQAPSAPFDMLGCEPSQSLMDYLSGSKRYRTRNPLFPGDLLVPDASGGHLGGFSLVGCQVVGWRESDRGAGLIDITVDAPSMRPSSRSKPIWESWRVGRPESINLWAEYDAAGRRAWLDVVGACTFRGSRELLDDPPGKTYELDGTYITDETSFYIAMGEAINGPAGYFGWNLNALADCTYGGFGATTPFTLVWRHSDIARDSLTGRFEDVDGEVSPPLFEVIVSLLDERSVDVVLA
ncbi:barstar family protein [Planotetraspora thailandica]|uniref:barstar family protein n=1 Tax=Planotetraspora thailandica TaxID=487172 RepID=UPI00194ED153|nr:barstar family protein [Planotetraspora thailandica]